MLTHRVLMLARLRGYVPHTWRGWLLLVTTPAYVVAIVAGLVFGGDAGASVSALLIVLVTASCLVLDARAFLTLGGRIQWGRLTFWRLLLALVAFTLLFIAPAVVLWQQVRAATRARRAALLARPGQIAALEHELGLDGPRSIPPRKDA